MFNERRIIALDSITVRRASEGASGRRGFFQGLLGASLSVYEAKDFIAQYHEILDTLFTKYQLSKEKQTYKAAEIYGLLATKPRAADAFVHDFGRKLLGIEGPKLNLFVCTFDIQKLIGTRHEEKPPQEEQEDLRSTKIVPIYGQSSQTILVSVPELIDKLQDPFPAICAWKLTQVTGIFNQQFLLDNFEGEESMAWQELISENQVFLVPKGSACNPYISAIDIFLRAANRILERKRDRLTPTRVDAAVEVMGKGLKNFDARVHHISNEDLHKVKPIIPKPIVSEYFVKHPVFFIYNEQDVKGEREEIENSPLIRKLHDMAYEKMGGVLFYKPDTSTRVMRPGDFFVAYGPKGELTYGRLKKLGYDLNFISMEKTH